MGSDSSLLVSILYIQAIIVIGSIANGREFFSSFAKNYTSLSYRFPAPKNNNVKLEIEIVHRAR